MSLNRESALEFLNIVNKIINNICFYAQKSFPNECCGFIMDNGTTIPASNIIDILGNPALTSKNAFLIDQQSWIIANNSPNKIISIFHSHPNENCNMSAYDIANLKWIDIYYVIVSILDSHPSSAKMFWWEESSLNELEIKL